MATTKPDYTVDYNDPRFTAINKEQTTTNQNINNTYSQMINQSNQDYENLIGQQDQFAQQQKEQQQQRADFEVEEVNLAKDRAQQAYEKEQRGSYINYQNQINPYGADAEQMRQLGLQNSGYSETSQVAMYNAYQNRIAVAKESFNKAITDYDMAIKDIRLQNDSKLLEIEQTSLQKKLELILQKNAAGNQLLQAQMDRQYQYDAFFETKKQNVLSQINTEHSLAEQVRQYNSDMAYKKERDKVADTQWQKTFNEGVREFNISQSNKYSGGGTGGGIKNQPKVTGTDSYGNSSEIQSKSDYYFDYGNDGNKENDFQPRYMNGNKLSQVKGKSGSYLLAKDLLSPDELKKYALLGVVGSNKIWAENGNYYVWSNKDNGYVNVTSYMKKYNDGNYTSKVPTTSKTTKTTTTKTTLTPQASNYKKI